MRMKWLVQCRRRHRRVGRNVSQRKITGIKPKARQNVADGVEFSHSFSPLSKDDRLHVVAANVSQFVLITMETCAKSANFLFRPPSDVIGLRCFFRQKQRKNTDLVLKEGKRQ